MERSITLAVDVAADPNKSSTRVDDGRPTRVWTADCDMSPARARFGFRRRRSTLTST